MILCPEHRTPLSPDAGDRIYLCGRGCQFPAPAPGVVDLLGDTSSRSAAHYTLQWGAGVDFASFYREHGEALSALTSKQMGWPALIERIRERSRHGPVRLLDAACGYGGLFMDLFEPPAPDGLRYVGVDIHGALPSIARAPGVDADRALFVRWDIGDPLPTADLFDFVICRAAIHHTPDPRRTFQGLAGRLAPAGTIAITAYARKGPMREAADDALRARIVPMSPPEALALARQFTVLGRDLQACAGTVEISEDLPFLGIRAGRYGLHAFIYDHLMKCWFNERFGERYSDVVNFDWYHPPHAHRYDLREITAWFDGHGVEVTDTRSTGVQHYVEGRRPG